MDNPTVRPVSPYVGGKRLLAPKLAAMIDAQPHRTYCDVFGGMGGVFFRREHRPKAEVINDRSREVANFFRILQRHYAPFVDIIRFQITSRDEFERLQATDPETLTDLERAARFLYLQRTTFGGKVRGRSFGVSPTRSGRFDVSTIAPLLEAAHERLAGVVIECLDFHEFIVRYDRPTTLFYLDPPYWGAEDFYGRELFSRGDFETLVERLDRLKGRFILSINDTPETRTLFDRFRCRGTKVTYSLPKSGSKKVKELIISSV